MIEVVMNVETIFMRPDGLFNVRLSDSVSGDSMLITELTEHTIKETFGAVLHENGVVSWTDTTYKPFVVAVG